MTEWYGVVLAYIYDAGHAEFRARISRSNGSCRLPKAHRAFVARKPA